MTENTVVQIGERGRMRGMFLAPVLIVGLALSSALAPAHAQEKCDDPLPAVNIISPTADVPAEIAQFSGLWKGKWGGSLCSSLAVEMVHKDGIAEVVYSWGKGRNFKAGYYTPSGKISDGTLRFGDRAKFTFWITDNGDLGGKRVFKGDQSRVTMKKVE